MCSRMRLTEFFSWSDYYAMLDQQSDFLNALIILSETPGQSSDKDDCIVCRKLTCLDRLCRDKLYENRICVDCLIKNVNLGYIPDM